ncbi:MAG: ABC transporter permease, partial [Chloroflexota bacterium]
MNESISLRSERGFWIRLRRLSRTWIGLALITPILLGALFAPQITSVDPIFQFRDGMTATGLPIPPGAKFPLGTDTLGRDVFSRV